MLPEGRLLGHYRLVRRIGDGGMGEVYLAEDTRISRQVAIKVVRTETEPYPHPVATQDTVRLFLLEMQAITMLDHPHILSLFDFGEEKDGNSILIYMVMPYRQEGSLADWLRQRGKSEKLAPGEVCHFVMQAADALQHAHDRHLIHQDVKPSNFLLRNRSGNVLPDLLLMDFGTAKITTVPATTSQNIRGTPAFMAPEQWEGQPQPATDQYALAITAYLLLTGLTPFSGSMEEVMRQHFTVQPQPPSSFNPAISPALDAVILRALEKQPTRRFPSMLEFAQAFQHTLQSNGNQGPIVLASQISQVISTPLPSAVYPARSGQLAPPVAAPRPDFSAWAPTVADINMASPNSGMPKSALPLYPIASQKVSRTQKSHWQIAAVLVLIVLVIVFSAWGVGIYQSDMQRMNATATAASNNATSQTNATATAQANATATARVIADNPCPYCLSGSGTLAFVDPLSQPDGSKWSASGVDSTGGACQFTGGAYHVNQEQDDSYKDCRATGTFSNFAFEVQLTIMQGSCGGMTFRDDSSGQFHSFHICQRGEYGVVQFSNSGSDARELQFDRNSAIHRGLGRQNTIAVVANGTTMTFYVNRQEVDQEKDRRYMPGVIGLIANPYSDTAADVVYSNARLWTL
jgi:serine/threonine protein kinase